MNLFRESQIDLRSQNEHLARVFYANGRYNPQFLAVTGVGFIVIYLLTLFGIFGQPAPQLIYIGVLVCLLAGSQILLLNLAHRNRGIAANLWGSATVGIFAILLTYFWQGILPIAILVALITPATSLQARLPRRYLPILLALVVLSIAGIIYADHNSVFNRLQNSTPAAIASFAFLIATGLLLVIITIVSQNKNFKSLQTLLLTSFIVIVTIPTIMAATLSAIGAFTNSQTQTFNTLKAISSLKENQISTLIHDSQNDSKELQNDSVFASNALNVLATKETNPVLIENSKQLARLRIQDKIASDAEKYSEVMVLNTQGQVVISTIPANEESTWKTSCFSDKERFDSILASRKYPPLAATILYSPHPFLM